VSCPLGRVRRGSALVPGSLLLLAACTIAARTEDGPTIHIELQAAIGVATDQDSAPALFLPSGDSSYAIDVVIKTTAGTSSSDSFSASPVISFSTSFAVGTTALPDSPQQYTSDGYSDPSFRRAAPLLIPASHEGEKLHVKVEAVDERGLAANLIDFAVSLN
jgi:hypothetical protein